MTDTTGHDAERKRSEDDREVAERLVEQARTEGLDLQHPPPPRTRRTPIHRHEERRRHPQLVHGYLNSGNYDSHGATQGERLPCRHARCTVVRRLAGQDRDEVLHDQVLDVASDLHLPAACSSSGPRARLPTAAPIAFNAAR